jgi:hypothetical protein
MTVRASIITRNAWLGKEFAENFARRLFGDEIVNELPRYVRGKNVGKFKVELEWIKVESGGWVSDGPGEGNGRVERRVGQVIAARLIRREFGTGHIDEIFATTGETGRFRDE